MKFQMTDFFVWEQPLIDQLRAEGKFIYGLRDGDGMGFSIAPNVVVNNIGFIITDTELDLGKYHEINDEEFYTLKSEKSDILRNTAKDMSDILAKAKTDYDAKEPEREKAWKEALSYQDNLEERASHYKLYQINRNAKKACVKAGINNYEIYIQVIEALSDNKQRVQYFVRDAGGKIVIDSTSIETKYNRRLSNILKDIAKLNNLD